MYKIYVSNISDARYIRGRLEHVTTTKSTLVFYHYVLYLKNERIDWLRELLSNPQICAQRPSENQPIAKAGVRAGGSSP